MVFRDFCALMDRHPPYINYGNAPPRDESFTRVDSENQTVAMPDYPARRMYKIDWKVCFMRHSRDSGRMAAYHAFVEDDSFVCSENLLHQAALLRDKNVTHFRTGTPMFTGFDDSSTVMSGDVALAFAEHYLEPGFNCSRLVDHVGSSDWVGAMWLSWGNSWKKDWCDWRVSLERVAHINVTEPVINCQWVVDHQHLHEKLPFPCLEHPIILHHTFAAKILLLNSSFAKHTCEHMLLIDKVKDPNQMQMLWEASSGHAFHDFSEVFEHPGIVGWQKVLLRLRNEEAACRVAEAMRAKGVTLSAQEQDEFRTLAETCLFQRRRRRLRAAEVHGRLFADAGADTDIDADAGADTDAGADVESDTHRGSRSGPHTIPTHFTHSAHSEVLTQNSLSPEAFYRVLLESTQ